MNIRKFIIGFGVGACVLAALTARAESLPADSLASNADVRRFYEGSLKIAQAEKSAADNPADANSLYAEAMDLLNERSRQCKPGIALREFLVRIEDDGALGELSKVDFSYDYRYARARYKGIDFAPSGVTRGGLQGCRVKNIVIRPKGSVTMTDSVSGDCLLVAMARPGDTFEMSVECAGTPRKVESYNDGMVSFAHWQAGDKETEAGYRISNPSDKDLYVTIFGN